MYSSDVKRSRQVNRNSEKIKEPAQRKEIIRGGLPSIFIGFRYCFPGVSIMLSCLP